MSRPLPLASSPLLASKVPPWRSKLLVGLMAAGFCVLVARALYIQVLRNDFFQQQGEVRFVRTLELPANRGRIFDRNGLLLATSVPAPSVWADPEGVDATPEQLARLAALLELPLPELKKKLSGDERNFVWLKRQVDEAVWQKIAEMNLRGIHERKEYRRKYPEGEAAAHVVGFTNVENAGQEGVELFFNRELGGRNGSQRVIKDRFGRVIESVGEQLPPVDGRDLQLSIDSKVQFFAWQKVREAVLQHRARAGSAVVLDAVTGEVLALANYPSYVPDKRVNLSGAQLRNIALTDTFEPGSTMKPFVVGLALESGRVRPSTPIQTAPGKITITGSTISDAHPHGMLTVEQVIQKSSNVGTVKLAMQLEPREMWEVFSASGFGQKPRLEFPGAVGGRLRPHKTWRPIEQATMSFGYGVSASLFQMARSYTVFAHDGQIVDATLLKREQPAQGVRVFSPETASTMRHMLQLAAGPGGTAPKAQTLGYSVGGKSGTARKQEGKGYTDKYRAWFTGMAPIDKPRVIVAVMIDEPSNGQYYGGAVAAPVFSEVVQHTLRMMGVQPDVAVKPQIITQQVQESF